MEEELIPCKRCNTPTDALALFPKGLCLKCYEKAYDATPAQELETIRNVFNRGGAVAKRGVK